MLVHAGAQGVFSLLYYAGISKVISWVVHLSPLID